MQHSSGRQKPSLHDITRNMSISTWCVCMSVPGVHVPRATDSNENKSMEVEPCQAAKPSGGNPR